MGAAWVREGFLEEVTWTHLQEERERPWGKGFLVLGEQKGQRPWGGFTLEMFQEMQGGPMAGGG